MKPCKALLLAGGLGTRLRPVTDTTPKCLVPINGRPLLDYWFDALHAAGIRDVLINTHHLRDRVSDYISDRNENGWSVEEAWEPELLGSAGTIRANPDWCDDSRHCLIIYADNLSEVNLGEFLKFHQAHDDPFSMMLFRTLNPRSCGIATLDANHRVVDFIEKPTEPTSDLANGGVYAITSEAYREIADMQAFDIGFDVLPRFVGRMRGWEFPGFHLDIGTHENLATANREAERLFSATKPT